MTLGRNLESETRHCFSGINVMVFYKEDLKRFCGLKTVQLRVQDKVNDRSFFFITQGMEGSTYNGQAEIVKQRKRWTFLTQHITNPWHLSQYTKEARNKYYFKKRLEKLMGKSPLEVPTWCWGSNLQLRKPLTRRMLEGTTTKLSLCKSSIPLKPSICSWLSLETGSQVRGSFGLAHCGHFRFPWQCQNIATSVSGGQPTWINQDQMYQICQHSLQPHISF